MAGDKAWRKVQARIEEGKELLERDITSYDELEVCNRLFDEWNNANFSFLCSLFTTDEYGLGYGPTV